MKEAVIVLRDDRTFFDLVIETIKKPKEETDRIFHAISILKAGIMKNAFSEGEGEDMRAFEDWPQLIAFIDTLMEGLSNA